MTETFRKKLVICWFAAQFVYFAMTTEINGAGTYWTESVCWFFRMSTLVVNKRMYFYRVTLSAVYAVVVCLCISLSLSLCVCVSICLSHSSIVSKWLNIGSANNATR